MSTLQAENIVSFMNDLMLKAFAGPPPDFIFMIVPKDSLTPTVTDYDTIGDLIGLNASDYGSTVLDGSGQDI